MNKMLHAPFALQHYATNFYQKHYYESKIIRNWKELRINPTALQELQNELKPKPLKEKQPFHLLPHHEQTLIYEIKQKVRLQNRNNLTRTKAYFEFFQKYPEIHWAFLAHLVSRNGGWNMTDLKGDLTEALNKEKRNHFFHFLESANALIFYDAYPQLLLYEESKKQKKNIFYLLPYFNVSSFMLPVWNYFFARQDSQFLTVSLIINEQHYIEKRVIQNTFFRKHVLDTLLFQVQELMQFTQVLLPYEYKKQKRKRLAGTIVENFDSISERIMVGKHLYAILFGLSPLFSDIYSFALNTSHSGSRADYWPTIFTDQKKKRTKKMSSSTFCDPIYSPALSEAWQDVTHTFTDHTDWFLEKKTDIDTFYETIRVPNSFDVTTSYYRNLQKIIIGSLAYEQAKKMF
ncbi:DUF2515 domain-containing protein [Alkalihalobacillus sp. MEB130]|uniref:DUF2515 family protein n=1 Tax=Alkalihalobacillus sp. MEB130 TaxID=2976704 RepID=UPI0028E001AD|nr:DUF2515 family protein [Alkalihalobacillus sp. MEB130]MDT8859717.1 DUF2515 domain-containing protein [Alkalihalobacillus sp. MEB130]